MADIEQFVIKTSLSSQVRPKRSSLMQKIHADKVTLRNMSKDGLVVLMQKQQQKIISRSALNDELLQNIKKAQLATKKFQEKILSMPDMRLARSRTSTSSVAASSPLLRSLSPGYGKPVPNGFQYRSNGNFRTLRRDSIEDKAERFEKTSQRDLTSLKQTLLKTTIIHSRDANGDYMFTPLVNKMLRKESRTSKSAPELSDNLDIFRFITKDHRQGSQVNSQKDSSIVLKNTDVRDRPLIGRRFLIKENDMFINNMMHHIYQLERHSNLQRYIKHLYVSQADLQEYDIPLRRGEALSKSDPSFVKVRRSPTRQRQLNGRTLQPNSSINVRYGVSSQTLESRKSLLDEQINKEMKKVSKTDIEIEDYIKDIETMMAEKEKKRINKEAKEQILLDILKAESDAI